MTIADLNYDYAFRDEIERKIKETLNISQTQYEQGMISADYYHGLLKGIEQTTNGLINEMLIIAVQAELEFLHDKGVFVAVYFKDHDTIVIRYKHGESHGVLLQKTKDAAWKKKAIQGEDPDFVEQTWQKIKETCSKIEHIGYRRLT